MLQQLTSMREEVLYAIFIDLHKDYYALDRDRFLEILDGYGVGTRARLILRPYWDRIRMVACAGGYYRAEFQGFWWATQGDLLYVTIFNVVVGAVVRHWILLAEEGTGGKYRWGR